MTLAHKMFLKDLPVAQPKEGEAQVNQEVEDVDSSETEFEDIN